MLGTSARLSKSHGQDVNVVLSKPFQIHIPLFCIAAR
jgi:hypothetical protein